MRLGPLNMRWLPAGSVALAYLWGLVFLPKPVLSGDSVLYKDPDVLHNYARIGLALTGRWFRPIFPVVPNELIGSYWWIAIVQLVVMGTAATWATFRITHATPSLRAGLISGFLAAAIFGSPYIMGFGVNILSEAWSFVFVSLFVGATTDVGRLFEWGWGKWAAVAGLSLALALARPYLLILVGATLLAGLVVQSRRARPWSGLMKAGAVIAVAAVLGALWWSGSESRWETSDIGHTASAAVYELSGYSPVSHDFAQWIQREAPAPSCLTSLPPFPADAAKLWTTIIPIARSCPAATEWLTLAGRSYPRFLATHPDLLIRSASWSIPRTFSAPESPEVVSVVPRPVSEALLGSVTRGAALGWNYEAWESSDPVTIQDPVWAVFGVVLAAVVLGLVRRRRSVRVQAAARFLITGTGALVAGVWVSLWEGNALGEMARLGAPMNLAFRLMLILASAQVALGLASWRRQDSAPEQRD